MYKKLFILVLTALIPILLLAMVFIGCERKEYDLAAYKESARSILTTYVETLNLDDYSDENWAAIEKLTNTGKKNIEAAENRTMVNAVLNAALKDIHLIDYEGRDFVLTIEVEETILPRGENFKVNIELKNNSGEDQNIRFDSLFGPNIRNWSIRNEKNLLMRHELHTAYKLLFEKNSVLRNIETCGFPEGPRSLGKTLTPGTHELRFGASFTLTSSLEDQQMIWVRSNIVVLTVL